MDDIFVVVVSQTTTQLLIIHLGFVLANSPSTRHLVRVGEFELPAVASPRYETLARFVCQQLQQELPQLDGARTCEARATTYSD